MMKFSLDHLPAKKQRVLEILHEEFEAACKKHLNKLARNAGMR